jgi:hypothetical protein
MDSSWRATGKDMGNGVAAQLLDSAASSQLNQWDMLCADVYAGSE